LSKSFLEKIEPSAPRAKLVPFPGAPGVEVRLRVLGQTDLERAHLETAEYFKKLAAEAKAARRPAPPSDPTAITFLMRERAALLFLAARDPESGEAISRDTDELAAQPSEVIAELYNEWTSLQGSVAARPNSREETDALVENLKKNIHSVRLDVLPSTLLSELVRTLVSRLATSTTDSSGGFAE